MKFFLLIILLILNAELFAQDSIPSFTELSKEVFKCLCNKDYRCLNSKMISATELVQLIEPMLQDVLKNKDSVVNLDTTQLALSPIVFSKVDGIYDRAKGLEINWDSVVFVSTFYDSAVYQYMLSEYKDAEAQCTLKFSEGENVYGIEYGLRFINNHWKIEEIHPYIVVYNKDGKVEGIMRHDGYDTYMDGYTHPPQKYKKKKR